MYYNTEAAALTAAQQHHGLLKNCELWKINTWDNMGWCWSLSHGPISLTFDERSETYSALVSDNPNQHGAGLAMWTDSSGGFDDPNKAVTHAADNVRQCVSELQLVVDAIKGL